MSEQNIVASALSKTTAAERDAFLDQACAGNAELRRRVEELLATSQAGEFLPAQPAGSPQVELGPTLDLNPSNVEHQPRNRTGRPARRPTAVADPAPVAEQAAGADNTQDDSGVLSLLDPPTLPDSLGRLDHYEMLSVLGRGGFGTVFRAFDEKLHRIVAIKVLAPQLSVSGPARARFLREARAAAGVRHDHVIDIHAVGDQPLPHLVMEYIAGQTLQEMLDQKGALPVKDILRIGYQIACGLAAAHTLGIIHRDIKPVNILLENGIERVKITDFGLARAGDDASLSASGVVSGTPQFMSPEQAQSQPLDPRSDLFSLGSTLYMLCTGRLPFPASTSLAVLKRVAEDQPTPIRAINPDIPEWLAAVVERLQAKNPDQRFQSAAELAELLAQYLADLQLHGSVRAVAMPRRVDKVTKVAPLPRDRRPVLVGAIAAAVILALGLAWLAWPTGINKNAVLVPGKHVDGKQADGPALAIIPFDEHQAAVHQEAWAKHLGLPVDFENSLGMKFRLVPAGEFDMGIGPAEIEQLKKTRFTAWKVWAKYAGPVHRAFVKEPFYLATCEVTVGQFRRFADAAEYQTLAEKDGMGGAHFANNKTQRRPEWTWRSPAFPQSEDHPAVHISWDDARAFCAWLTTKEGRAYSLPSEEQWEFACRAGGAGAWCFGNDGGQLAEYGNARTMKGTEPVASRKANAFGLFDLHGNVLEWCNDNWVPYPATPDITCPERPADPSWFVQRGGCFVMHEIASQSGFRIGQARTTNGSAEGFRIALAVRSVMTP